jgi:hypothetical protein
MFLQNVHAIHIYHGHGHGGRTLDKDMHQKHAVRTWSMDTQRGHGAWKSSMNVKDGHGLWTCNMDMLKRYAMRTWRMDATSVSDPDLVGSAFNLGLNPGSGSAIGIRIQMSKNRF